MRKLHFVVRRNAWLWLVLAAGALVLGLIAVIAPAGLSARGASSAPQRGAEDRSSSTVAAQGPQPQAPQAALGAGFTYQGQLKNSGGLVNGTCDSIFVLYDSVDSSGSNNIIGLLTPIITVTNGLFTTALDFGPAAFDGSARWLELWVGCPKSVFPSRLTPRQPLTAAPYALFSGAPWATSGANLSYSLGKVGIGMTGLLELLTVGTNSSNAIHLGTSDPASGAWLRNDGSNTVLSTNLGSLFLGYGGNAAKSISIGNSNPGAVFVTGSAPAGSLFVESNGNVGIGTMSPAAKLTVRTATGNYGFVQTDGTASVGSWVGGSPEAGWYGTLTNHPLNLYVNAGSPSMVISSTGHIGIGTSDSYGTLTVKGTGSDGSGQVLRVVNGFGELGLAVVDDGTVLIGTLHYSSTTHLCVDAPKITSCSSAAEYVPNIDDGSGIATTADLGRFPLTGDYPNLHQAACRGDWQSPSRGLMRVHVGNHQFLSSLTDHHFRDTVVRKPRTSCFHLTLAVLLAPSRHLAGFLLPFRDV